MVFRDKVDMNAHWMPLWNESTSILPLHAFLKPKHACSVKPEVLKSWTLEMDYSRAPCLGADQRTRGLWERDCDWVASDACAIVFQLCHECQHQLLQEADGRTWAHGIHGKHGGEALTKGDLAKTLDLLTCKHQSFTSGTDTFVSLPTVIDHGKSFIL